MKRYQCHKQVNALKIEAIEQSDADVDVDYPGGSYELIGDDPSQPLRISAKYVDRHNPQVGGYYVRYDDGYESYSPAKAFEEGYTPVP